MLFQQSLEPTLRFMRGLPVGDIQITQFVGALKEHVASMPKPAMWVENISKKLQALQNLLATKPESTSAKKLIKDLRSELQLLANDRSGNLNSRKKLLDALGSWDLSIEQLDSSSQYVARMKFMGELMRTGDRPLDIPQDALSRLDPNKQPEMLDEMIASALASGKKFKDPKVDDGLIVENVVPPVFTPPPPQTGFGNSGSGSGSGGGSGSSSAPAASAAGTRAAVSSGAKVAASSFNPNDVHVTVPDIAGRPTGMEGINTKSVAAMSAPKASMGPSLLESQLLQDFKISRSANQPQLEDRQLTAFRDDGLVDNFLKSKSDADKKNASNALLDAYIKNFQNKKTKDGKAVSALHTKWLADFIQTKAPSVGKSEKELSEEVAALSKDIQSRVYKFLSKELPKRVKQFDSPQKQQFAISMALNEAITKATFEQAVNVEKQVKEKQPPAISSIDKAGQASCRVSQQSDALYLH